MLGFMGYRAYRVRVYRLRVSGSACVRVRVVWFRLK